MVRCSRGKDAADANVRSSERRQRGDGAQPGEGIHAQRYLQADVRPNHFQQPLPPRSHLPLDAGRPHSYHQFQNRPERHGRQRCAIGGIPWELLDKYGANRLSHLDAYFNSSREYSDSHFLIIPSEEGNGSKDHLISHWMQLFPKPVYFTWTRNAGQPFSETLATYGTVYHLGSQTDLLNLLAGEQAVAWTAHPRIKGSYASPDDYKTQSWYRSETWLGGAWKAMPGDLSQPLGMRVFKLLHDMNNWGQVKYTHGEVDFL